MSKYPKYLNKVMLTKQKIADHEYTVLYDRQGNKYLKLEKFNIQNTPLHIDTYPTPLHAISSKTLLRRLYD